jgi:hypothetical protein
MLEGCKPEPAVPSAPGLALTYRMEMYYYR